MKNLSEKKVAILTENGFEEVELTSPKKALEDEGITVHIISPQKDKVKAWDTDHWSIELPVDVNISQANPEDYDALVLPGGVMNPDKTRMNKDCVSFVKEFLASGKPVAAICHAPQLLIETDMLNGKKITSYPSLKTDLLNAGARWEDSEVVIDGNIITSRNPNDLPAFNRKLLSELEEGVLHQTNY